MKCKNPDCDKEVEIRNVQGKNKIFHSYECERNFYRKKQEEEKRLKQLKNLKKHDIHIDFCGKKR